MTGLPKIFGEGRARGVATIAALAVSQAAAAGVAAFAMRDVFTSFASPGAAIPIAALAAIAGAGVMIATLRVAERSIAERVGQEYAASLRKCLFRHLTRVSAQEISKRRNGSLAIRFVGDLAAVRSWVSLGIARMISAGIVLPGAILALILLDPLLAAATAAPLILSLAVMATLAPRLAPLHRRLRNKRARLAADMIERIPVAPELRLLGREGREIERLNRRARSLRVAAVERTRASAGLRAVPEIGATTAGIALLCAAFSTGAAGAEAAGALAALSIIALPLRDLATVWDRYRAWEVARDKCQVLLSVPVLVTSSEIEERSKDKCRKRGPVRLDFDHVTAGALRDIRATARPGEKIAIIGGNGAGKSTLLSLAAGLENAATGVVAIDSMDIRTLPQDEKRETIGYLGAHSPILAGSLRRALTLGMEPRPNDEMVESAASRHGLGSVLERLGRLDGRVAEGGRNLSSGEARRVHLVRAILAKPDLLLLDEPDDALDVEGRDRLRRLITESPATTLIVTHDLSLARLADVVWYVEAGRLRATGTPAELLNGAGRAARFCCPRQAA